MKILNAGVDWEIKWSSDPTIHLYVDGRPGFYDSVFEERGGYYSSNNDGIVHTIYKKDPAIPDEGYGGRFIELKMADGTIRSWHGGWAAASWYYNKWYPEKPIVEACVYTLDYPNMGIASFITLDLAKQLIANYNWPFHFKEMRVDENGPYYALAINGLPPKSGWITEEYFNGYSGRYAVRSIPIDFKEQYAEYIKHHPELEFDKDAFGRKNRQLKSFVESGIKETYGELLRY